MTVELWTVVWASRVNAVFLFSKTFIAAKAAAWAWPAVWAWVKIEFP